MKKNKKFFRILRVKIDNECPFWVGDFICNNKKCAICECNQNDVIIMNYLKDSITLASSLK